MFGSLTGLLVALAFAAAASARLETVFQWKYIDYVWESEEQKNEFVNSGKYNASSIVPADVYKVPDGRVFISIVGKDGVPARFTTVSSEEGPSGPLLKPYPSWEWFADGDCNGITSVYRVSLDNCNRLWVMDTGLIEGSAKPTCSPQILVFNLKTNRLVDRIKIPQNLYNPQKEKNLFANPIVQTSGLLCEHTTVYLADTYGRDLLVLNKVLKDNKFKRYDHSSFQPVPGATTFTIAGQNFTMAGGLLAMALSPRLTKLESSRYLIYKPLASYALYRLDLLTLPIRGVVEPFEYQELPQDQIISIAVSKGGAVFASLSSADAVGCFNYKSDRAKLELLAQDSEALRYVNGVHVFPADHTGDAEEELWLLSNRFTEFLSKGLDLQDVNFRVLKASVRDLVSGTKCVSKVAQLLDGILPK